MASEQSSREVLKRPLVAALTPKMSDAAIRAWPVDPPAPATGNQNKRFRAIMPFAKGSSSQSNEDSDKSSTFARWELAHCVPHWMAVSVVSSYV